MSTDMMWQTESHSSEQTVVLAEQIGRKLRGGEVIELVSDLGGGKTTFVRGLAAGMGSQDKVTSPSFTINQVYKGQRLVLNHFDFYRLAEAGVMAEELAELIVDPESVVVVEWGDIVEDVLPAKRLKLRITPTGETERHLEFSYPKSLSYLLPENT